MLWDAGKIQACRCDKGYKGPDCSVREVPRGDDPLTSVKSDTMTQYIQLTDVYEGDQFFLNYYDPYGGKWSTQTIRVPHSHDSTGNWAHTAENDAIIAILVEKELRDLPNEVLRDIEVTAAPENSPGIQACHRFYDGFQHIAAHSQTTDGIFKNSKGTTNFCEWTNDGDVVLPSSDETIDLFVEFADLPGQTGVQYLLEVDMGFAGPGHYPVSGGSAGSVTIVEVNYNDNLGNLSELADCSDRGLDNGDGDCDCFDGFRGLACQEQEALV